MKKIIIGLVVLSALSFGAMKSDKINMNNNCQRGTRHSQMMDGLSEGQQNELTSMMESKKEANYKESLNLRTKQLELEKLLSNDEINWESVEKINDQISDMRSEQSLDNMKFRKEIEEKFGITMKHRHKGMNGNHGHMGNGMRDKNHREHMGNGMKDKNHREHMGNGMMDGLSESQQNELTSMMESKREANYKESLNLRIKQLELEKLLSNDEINWKSVEKINDQISDMRSEQSLDSMKFRKGIEEKFGITMGRRHKGMNENHGHMGNGMMDENYREHMGNGMMDEARSY